MTEEQFERLMKKLEDIERRLPPIPASITYPVMPAAPPPSTPWAGVAGAWGDTGLAPAWQGGTIVARPY